jgi:hypothetical protein
VHVPGQFCLGVVCYSDMPASGGTSYWSIVNGGATLQPLDVAVNTKRGMVINTTNNNFADAALSAFAGSDADMDTPTVMIKQANLNGTAADIAERLVVPNNLNLYSASNLDPVTIQGQSVWYPGNDISNNDCDPSVDFGQCGPDADMLDGIPIGFNTSLTQGTAPGGGPFGACNGYCLCTTIFDPYSYYVWTNGCIDLGTAPI